MAYVVSGNTYPIRHELRLVGCRYEKGRWVSGSPDVIERLNRLGVKIKNLKIALDESNSEK